MIATILICVYKHDRIMQPLVSHAVLTTKPSVCFGWHCYCAQTLNETALGIFQSFIYSKRVTNTHHVDALQGLQRMLVYWMEKWAKNESPTQAGRIHVFLFLCPSNLTYLSPECVVSHQLNLLKVHNVTGLIMVCNIACLGTILDYRRYLPLEEGGLSSDMWIRYSLAKRTAENILKWVYPRYHLKLMREGRVVRSKNCSDADRLKALRIRLLVEQCKALVMHSTKEDADGPGYDSVITSEDLQATIESDFSKEESFMARWPKAEKWKCIREDLASKYFTYSFPPPPSGCEYLVEYIPRL